MAQNNQEWDELGRNIQDIIDRAVKNKDFQKLNQTISQTLEQAVSKGSDALRKTLGNLSGQGTGKKPQSSGKPPVVQQKNLPVLYGKTGGKTAVGILKIVGGGLTVTGTGAAVIATFVTQLLLGGFGAVTAPGWFPLTALAVGIGFIVNGISNLNWLSRFKTYRKILGQKTYCSLEKLARGVRKSVRQVKRELRGMIKAGLFLEGHLDNEETMLITSDETYRYYEHSRLQLEERKKLEQAEKDRRDQAGQDPRVREVLDRGDEFLRQIRQCNDRIPGLEISEKISRMEEIVQRIFRRAQECPQVVPDLKKLMEYYLPMTVKLLRAYADMDEQSVQGQNIESAKAEIEKTLDTLNLAFEKLLDDLFEDIALDVSSDISVLNTLLAQEGLTDDDLSRMRRQNNMEKS